MKKSKQAAVLGIFSALACSLSFLESLLPPVPGFPPGAKLGLSNVVTMFTVSTFGLPSALVITIIKALFSMFTRSFTAGVLSFSGGLLSTIVMWLLLKVKKDKVGYVGVGILCAVAHNLGQTAAAIIITRTWALVYYFPVLMLFSIATGILTGAVLKAVLPVLQRKFINNTNHELKQNL